MDNLLTILQCLLLKTKDTLEENQLEIDKDLKSYLSLKKPLHLNPYPEFRTLVKYKNREYDSLCRRCKGVCVKNDLSTCSASGFSLPCDPQQVFMFSEIHKETGGYSEVRILECDIYKRYPSSSKEEALLHFQEMFGAYRVKAILYSDSGVKWTPYSDSEYDNIKLSDLI